MDGAKRLQRIQQLAVFFVVITWTSLIQVVVSREYCQFDIFNASCAVNQVILIDEARYGRLQLGRCVTRDYGYIGCSASVVDLLDRTCSGRRTCRFSVPALRELVQPCPKDLTSYLDVTYRCVSVFDVTSRCNATVPLDDINPTTYLLLNLPPSTSPSPSASASVADLQHSGRSTSTGTAASSAAISPAADPSALPTTQPSASCPATFSVRSGQRIAITLYSFRAAGANDNLVADVGTVVGGGSRGPGAPSRQSSSESVGGRSGMSSLSSTAIGYCSAGSLVVVDGPAGGSVTGRRRVVRLCDVRQHREQIIMATNTSTVSVFFDGTGGTAQSLSSLASASGTTKVAAVVPRRQQQKSDQQSESAVDSTVSRGRIIYIVKFEATGCADLEPPTNARIDRYDDSLVVKCNLSQETWYLTCKGTTWIGAVTNCSEGLPPHNEEIGLNTVSRRKHVPFGLWMAVAIGISLGVIFGFIMLITVFIYRRCKLIRSPPKLNVLLGPSDDTVMQDATTAATTTISSSSTYAAHVDDYYITCGGRRMIYADPSTIEICGGTDLLRAAPPSRTTYVIASPPINTGWSDPPPLPAPELYFAAAFRRGVDCQALDGSTSMSGGTDLVDGVVTRTSTGVESPLLESADWTIHGEPAESVSHSMTLSRRLRGSSVGVNGGRPYHTLQLNKLPLTSSSPVQSSSRDQSSTEDNGDRNQSCPVDYGRGRLGATSLTQSLPIAVLMPPNGARCPSTPGGRFNENDEPTSSGNEKDRKATPPSNTTSKTMANSVRFAELVDSDYDFRRGDNGGEISTTTGLGSGDERPDLVRDGRRLPPQWHYHPHLHHHHHQAQLQQPPMGTVKSLTSFAVSPSDQQNHHQHYEAQQLIHLPPQQQQRSTPQTTGTLTAAGVTFRDWQESPVLNI